MLYRLISKLLVPVLWWGRVRLRGTERLPASGPVLVVPNHEGEDPQLLATRLLAELRDRVPPATPGRRRPVTTR